MASWNHLSVESKQEVIQYLDLMSRNAMKSVSRLDREIVNSVDFYVPRVRLSSSKPEGSTAKSDYTESNYLIHIYTGIEKFLRVEIVTEKKGVMVYRMENTYNRSEGVSKAIPTINSFPLAIKILKSLFTHPSITLGALEFELYDLPVPQQQSNAGYIIRYLDGEMFRTKTLITNYCTNPEFDMMIFHNILDLDVIEEIRNDGIRWDTEWLHPKKMIDKTIPSNFVIEGPLAEAQKLVHVPSYESHIWLADNRAHQYDVLADRASICDGFATIRFHNDELWVQQKHPIEQINEHVQVKRIAVPSCPVVIRWNKSKCGYWTHMMTLENEEKCMDYFKNEKCGLRYLCKNCTDPFEYWFYQQLPRRVLHEPKWAKNGLNGEFTEEENKEMIQKMNAQFAKDEKKNKKKENGEKKKALKSWGFRKSLYPKPAPKFIPGVDFDDIESLVKQKKAFNVNMDFKTFKVNKTSWIHESEIPSYAMDVSEPCEEYTKALLDALDGLILRRNSIEN
ncbi:unnamed protein product [Caenorhabditis nigoni]